MYHQIYHYILFIPLQENKSLNICFSTGRMSRQTGYSRERRGCWCRCRRSSSRSAWWCASTARTLQIWLHHRYSSHEKSNLAFLSVSSFNSLSILESSNGSPQPSNDLDAEISSSLLPFSRVSVFFRTKLLFFLQAPAVLNPLAVDFQQMVVVLIVVVVEDEVT